METLVIYNTVRLKEAQDASLDILLAIDRICRENGISYMMDSGTLLGAVRHQGFIPWDDDVDIVMTRENFRKFQTLAKEALPEGMELILPDEYRGGEAFYDFTPRIIQIYSRRRTVSEETDFYEGKLNHLWVDIFLQDSLPDGRLAAWFIRFRQKVVYGLSMAHRYRVDLSKYQGLDRLKVRILTAIGKHIPMKKLFAKQEKLSVKYNDKNTENLYYSNYQPDYLQDTVKREWSEHPKDLLFEGHMLMAPGEPEKVLTEIYGDYMQLPPEEKRVPSHSDDIEVFHDKKPAPPVTRQAACRE